MYNLIQSFFYFFLQIYFTKSEKNTTGRNYGAYLSIPSTKLQFRMGAYISSSNNDTMKLCSIYATKGGLNTQKKEFSEKNFFFKNNYYYNSQIETCQYIYKLGQKELIGMLTTPSNEHSTDITESENKYYKPKNLYKDIWIYNEQGNKEINKDNYWAYYIYNIVTKYQHYIKIWEIWDEPDYISDNNILIKWNKNFPDENDLIQWHGSIFSYIRLLRISYEVIKYIDPSSYVSVGGLNYPKFLEYILNYTDNENENGTINNNYPYLGGAYFDCLSYRFYPHFNIKNIETNEYIDKNGSDILIYKIITAKKNFEYILKKVNLFDNINYPEKLFVISSTGVASEVVDDYIGGENIRKNFLLKLPFYCILNNIKQVHYYSVIETTNGIYKKMADYRGSLFNDIKIKTSTNARKILNIFNINKMIYNEKLSNEIKKQINNNNIIVIALKSNFSFSGESEYYDNVIGMWVKCENDENPNKIKVKFKLDFNFTMIDSYGNRKKCGKNIEIELSGQPVFFMKGNFFKKKNILNYMVFIFLMLL